MTDTATVLALGALALLHPQPGLSRPLAIPGGSPPAAHSSGDRSGPTDRVPRRFAVESRGLVHGSQQSRERTIEVPPEIDPYTEGDGAAMARLDYVSFGDFSWADGHGTPQIRAALGGIPVLFVETAHFKIASTLGTHRHWNDPQEKKRIRAELRRLKERLPGLLVNTREIDPWLRLHLVAQRLETLYTQVEELFCVGEEDLLEQGVGRYLGKRSKYTVLLCERSSDFGFYAQTYLDHREPLPKRYFFARQDTLLFASSLAFMPGENKDAQLHCSMVYGVAQNLIEGLCGRTTTPVWLQSGLAHWLSRQVDERWNVYAFEAEQRSLPVGFWDWEPKVRARLKHGLHPSWHEIAGWVDEYALDPAQRMFIWSRVDHLLAELEDREDVACALGTLARSLRTAKPLLSPEARAARQVRALSDSFGLSEEELEEAWERYVKREYSR